MVTTQRLRFTILCILLAIVGSVFGRERPRGRKPNILFIILDDVGVDQIRAFNPFLPTIPTPNIEAVAEHGVKFKNHWAMPECSPSRACFFTGRYPMRTGVDAALLPDDLPKAQLSPYEATIPTVLGKAGYRSALIGKYHLGGPENNPAGNLGPYVEGWNFFDGSLAASPPAIDTTLGGQYLNDAVEVRYPCGFPTGPETGAAWFLDGNGVSHCDDNSGAGYTGQQALALGGISALDANGNLAPSCNEAQPIPPDFTRYNAYYCWPHTVIDHGKLTSTTARNYITSAQTDAAISWIKEKGTGRARQPWMCTVSYSSIHTPYQQPPPDLYPPGFIWPVDQPIDPSSPAVQKILGELMLFAMDKEIGRLLVGCGLAETGPGGELIYRPELTDTMVIIAGDNGTFFPSVNFPYNHLRSKGTPYQTGVTTPLVVAGPLVSEPGRTVDSIVNCVDLFQLFGEIARLDVRKVVPKSHILDSFSMLPYLTNPSQQTIRPFNFTQLGNGLKAPEVKLWPCVLEIPPNLACTDILFTSQEICEAENGMWFGPTEEQPTPEYPFCCDVRQVLPEVIIVPLKVWSVRNDRYKLVKNDREACDVAAKGVLEFYDLAPTAENPIGLDATDLLTTGVPVNLTPEQTANFNELQTMLNEIVASEPACPGDGNLDKKVDAKDIQGFVKYQGQPSVFDMNNDSFTNGSDLLIIQENLGHNCLQK